MGLALHELKLKDNKDYQLFSYDIWRSHTSPRDFVHQKSSFDSNMNNFPFLDELMVVDNVDFYQWIKNPVKADMYHLDIANCGEKVLQMYNHL